MPLRVMTHDEASAFDKRYKDYDPIHALVVGTRKQVLSALNNISVDVRVDDTPNHSSYVGSKVVRGEQAVAALERLDLVQQDVTKSRDFRLVVWA